MFFADLVQEREDLPPQALQVHVWQSSTRSVRSPDLQVVSFAQNHQFWRRSAQARGSHDIGLMAKYSERCHDSPRSCYAAILIDSAENSLNDSCQCPVREPRVSVRLVGDQILQFMVSTDLRKVRI
jgi:hypothetical protein